MDKAHGILINHYALVYKVDKSFLDTLKDVGDDPCFEKPATWGICRPNIRNRLDLDKGSFLIFIANVSGDYFLKGCFKVIDKIDIIQAYKDFSQRQNVIISPFKSSSINKKWNYGKRKKLWEATHGKTIPDFFQTFNHDDQIFYQRSNDGHGVDNWKCSRINNCRNQTFENCVASNLCIKERDRIRLKKNYIVGDSQNTYDWTHMKLKWEELVEVLDFPRIIRIKIRENVYKHPEITIPIDKVLKLIDYVSEKNKKQMSGIKKS